MHEHHLTFTKLIRTMRHSPHVVGYLKNAEMSGLSTVMGLSLQNRESGMTYDIIVDAFTAMEFQPTF
jgi:hypothetical protein